MYKKSATQVQSDISMLAETIEGLPSSDELDALIAQIGSIQTALDNAVTQEEVDQIEADVIEIKDALNDFLSQNASVQGPLRITNLAELEYVQSLGEITNLSGDLTVDVSSSAMQDSIAAVNAVLNTINVISGEGSLYLTGGGNVALDASSLTYVNGELVVKTKQADLSALKATTSTITLDYPGDFDFPLLGSSGDVVLTDSASTTLVNFPLLNGSSGTSLYLNNSGTVTSVITFVAATKVVIGNLEVSNLTANKATEISLGYTGSISDALNVSGTKAGSIINISATKIGDTSVVGSDSSMVNLSSLTETTGSLAVTAVSIDAPAVKTISGTLTLTDVKTAEFTLLATVSGTTTAPDATSFKAPALTGTHSITLAAAKTIEVKSVDETLLTAPAVETLTQNRLSLATMLDVSGYSTLKTLTVTGAKATGTITPGVQTNSLTASGTAVLESVTLSGALGSANIANNPKLATVSTSGEIVSATIDNNSLLTMITFGHSFLAGENACTINVLNNSKLETLDMTSVQKIGTLNINTNPKLTSIKVGTPETLAEPIAAINYAVHTNGLKGTYTAAKAGTPTTPYASFSATQSDLYSIGLVLTAYVNQGTRTVTPTFNLDFSDNTLTTDTTTDTLSFLLDGDSAAQLGADAMASTADDESDNATNSGSGISSIVELSKLLKE